MSTNLPPVPHQVPIADQKGIIPAIWSDWFKQVFARIGQNIALSNTELAAFFPVAFANLRGADWSNSQSTSGYQKLGSGLYAQWGVTGSVASGTNSTISFPIAFPTACFQVLSGIQGNAAGSTSETGHFGTGNYTRTGFNLNNRTTAAYTFNWMAVGN